MTISSSMPYIRLQPPIATLFFTHKLRSLPSPLGSKPAVASCTILSNVSSFPSNHYPTRCFHIVDTTESEPWDYDDDEAANRRGYYSKSNALLSKGPRGTYVTKKSEEGMYVRVDIPGVGIDGLKIWVEEDSVLCFEGKSLRTKYMGPRSYGGGFICCPNTYDLQDMRCFLGDGVLRMVIPKNKSSTVSSNSLTEVTKIVSPSFTKVATTPTTDTDIADDHEENDDKNAICLEFEKWTEKHPFQLSGPRRTWVVKRIHEALLLRFDMPGVGNEDLKVWINGDTVFYEGKFPKESEHEDGRHYSGTLVLSPGWCNKDEVVAEVYNGVIQIIMPSMKFRGNKRVEII